MLLSSTPGDIRLVSDVLIQIDFLTVQAYPEDSEASLYLSYGTKKGLSSDGGNPRSRTAAKSNQHLFGMKPACSGNLMEIHS